jgi:hypothetical protein
MQIAHPRCSPVASLRARFRSRSMIVACLLVAALSSAAPAAFAAPVAAPVDLGSAVPYAVLSGASIGNTVSAPGAPHTTVHGALAVKVAASPLGFPPGVVTGAFDVGNAAAAAAHADATAAYTEIAARTGGTTLAGALAGQTITPGLYTIAGAVSNTTTVTLDAGGNANAYFVFQVGGAMALAAASHVVLAGGAQASHVFWQVNGAGAVGAGSTFAGTMIALDAGAVGAGTIVNGRVFALGGALTLDTNDIYAAPPAVTIDGGSSAYTADTTPTIAGTTDQQAPTLVTVTVNGQTLTASPSAGSWSVDAPMLANGVYPVTASATDGAGNTTTRSQQLTVDTVLPVILIASGASLTTNSRTPSIAGTSDVAPSTLVRVDVDSQTLWALVQADGSWNISPPALTEGDHHVTASVFDPAGNQGSATETITIDTTPPQLTITGGANALTNDATPTIAGSAAVVPGTLVTVALADQTLTAAVQSDGSFAADSSFLGDGPHRVIVDVVDGAGNATRFTQTLRIDTVSPIVTITGGAAISTTNLSPTIVGTTDAAPGTTMTVTIAGQTMTTLVQANGSWNATPSPVGLGPWQAVASVPDPAGNVGGATQMITVATAGSPPADPPVDPAVPTSPVATPPPPAGGAPAPPAIPDAPTAPSAPSVPAAPATPDGTFEALSKLTITPDGRKKLSGSRLSIGTRVTASAGGRLVVTANGSVKIAGVSRAIRLTTRTSTLAAGTSAMLTIAPQGRRKAARAVFARCTAAIRAGKKVTATITLTLADTAGHSRIVTRIVQLT